MECRLSIEDGRLKTGDRRGSIAPPTRGNQQFSIFNPKWIRTILLVLAAGHFAYLGCSAPRRTWVPPQSAEQFDDTSFLHYLALAPVATVDEGARAVLMLIGPTDPGATFEQRWGELERLGAARSSWGCASGDTLEKGTLAYLLARICELPLGPVDWASASAGLGDRRYALRSCAYHGLLTYGLPQDPVTGGELLSALTAAESRVSTLGVNGS